MKPRRFFIGKAVGTLVVLSVVLVGAAVWYVVGLSRGQSTGFAANYKDATYVIDGHQLTLKNGTAQVPIVEGSASVSTIKYFGNEAKGDLNSDGVSDVAFLLTQENGGSGTFYYIVVALKSDAGYTGTNALFLGDRIAPQTTEIRHGEIVVNYATRAENEPMTATPSVGVSRYFRVEDGALIEIEH